MFSQLWEKSFLQQEMNDHDYHEGHSKEFACKVLANDALYLESPGNALTFINFI